MTDTLTKVSFLNGDRISLREVQTSDVTDAYYQWMNSPEINRYLESRFYPHSKEDLRAFVSHIADDKNHVFLAMIHKYSHQHIGNIKLGPINWIHRHANIGLLIGEKDFWGQGLATEAIQLVVQYAFDTLNLHKLMAGCYADNSGSARAFQKAGFEIEGVRKSHFYHEGSFSDEILLGLVQTP